MCKEYKRGGTMNDFKRVGDKLLTVQNTGLFSGYIPVEIETVKNSELVLNYTGGKIDSNVWNQIKSFLQWTYTNSGGEGQIRLFYNPTTCTWKAHPFEQFVSKGLTTDEKKDSDLSKKVVESMLSQGYINNGTVHHHCSISAFQSGTDLADEIKQNGLHITLGFMDKEVYGYHSRATLRGVCYSIVDSEWIESLDLSNIGDSSFPPDWKNYVVEKPVVPVTVWGMGQDNDLFDERWYGRTWNRAKTTDIPSIVETREPKESIENVSDDDFIYSIDPDELGKLVETTLEDRAYLINHTTDVKDMLANFIMKLIERRQLRLVDIEDVVSYIESALNLKNTIGLAMLDVLDDIIVKADIETAGNKVSTFVRCSMEDIDTILHEIEEEAFFKEDIQ